MGLSLLGWHYFSLGAIGQILTQGESAGASKKDISPIFKRKISPRRKAPFHIPQAGLCFPAPWWWGRAIWPAPAKSRTARRPQLPLRDFLVLAFPLDLRPSLLPPGPRVSDAEPARSQPSGDMKSKYRVNPGAKLLRFWACLLPQHHNLAQQFSKRGLGTTVGSQAHLEDLQYEDYFHNNIKRSFAFFILWSFPETT